jgi:hypothetical protein
MKKLKTLCAIVGAAAMLYSGAAFAAKQKFNVPDYSTKGIEGKISYNAITPFGLMPINDPKDAGELPVLTITKYLIDRNKDGKPDLIHMELNVPEMENEAGKQPSYVVKQVYIDEDFNGYVERMLTDQQDEQGKPGADGIFDEEQYALRIQDI